MRVLLAGASGRIGRLVIPRLIAAGHGVVGTTRHPGGLAGTGAEEFVGDVLNRSDFVTRAAGLGCDAVVHHVTDLRRPPRRPRQMTETNRLRSEGTSTLIAAARAMGAKRFVAASVVYGYGFRDHGDALLTEDAPFGDAAEERERAVQRALLSLEQQVAAFGGVTLRFGLFYAADDPIPVVARDADGTLPFVHIEDAADATVVAVGRKSPGVFNIVDDEAVSWRELHAARAAALGARPPRTLAPWLLDRAAPFAADLIAHTSMRVSNVRARRGLRWKPRYSTFRDALTRV
ncbi:NAD(P)-dependent oxidoreductase [Galbitalea sp. SE-J8]|uniref:NAD-dependent epimerase/dehydratase family protein n=1 Tax=Galbitalea sp. SE-J8 TaxID=3054952 RepID=UPI00259C6A43|nr:NAD(P)-dependent oxidoreductase [Galbitalea sp. SE-J8]MDM4762787.1 NAD(P)-dependent oxidoreductase [Galbitalea sp. SE-J8]